MTLRLVVALLVLLGACSGGEEPTGDPVAGQAVVEGLENSCGLCHTLESAGFVGTAAPSLDDMQPGYDRVLEAVRTGPGVMPSYSEALSSEELHDLAAYISRETSR